MCWRGSIWLWRWIKLLVIFFSMFVWRKCFRYFGRLSATFFGAFYFLGNMWLRAIRCVFIIKQTSHSRSCHGFHVTAVLSWLCCLGCLVMAHCVMAHCFMAVLSWLACRGCLPIAVLSWLLFWLSCQGCSKMVFMLRLFSTVSQFCHESHVTHVFSELSSCRCPVIAVVALRHGFAGYRSIVKDAMHCDPPKIWKTGIIVLDYL
jgi:hypothetical protein